MEKTKAVEALVKWILDRGIQYTSVSICGDLVVVKGAALAEGSMTSDVILGFRRPGREFDKACNRLLFFNISVQAQFILVT